MLKLIDVRQQPVMSMGNPPSWKPPTHKLSRRYRLGEEPKSEEAPHPAWRHPDILHHFDMSLCSRIQLLLFSLYCFKLWYHTPSTPPHQHFIPLLSLFSMPPLNATMELHPVSQSQFILISNICNLFWCLLNYYLFHSASRWKQVRTDNRNQST